MKLRCLIVEDEPLSTQLLESYCRKTDHLQLLGSVPNAEAALAFLQDNEIDVIFLDVEMPGITGFQLIDRLPNHPYIVLTTSKTEYAFTAFEYQVTDYLKKPIGYKRFQESVNKLVKQASLEGKLQKHTPDDDIFIKSEGKLIHLAVQDILYIECIGDYVKYVTGDKSYLTYATMKSVEEKIDKKLFLRVHRTFIVNMKKIKDIQDNSLVIGNTVIPISRANKPEVMRRLRLF